MQDSELEDVELDLLLEGIYRRYGYDFRDYDAGYIRRRLVDRMQAEKIKTISGFQEIMLHNANRFAEFLLSLSTGVTAMFRDPDYYLALRNKAIPRLRDLPFIRIWHAGCSTGEEVYSTAILLQEEDLYDRCRIYATDINEVVLETAKAGIFPLRSMRDYTANYLDAGGNGAFSEFYAANYNKAIFRRDLKKNIVFAPHNLVTDASINVFHIVACRNVMIYFNQSLQARVLNLLDESLLTGGVLGLGKRETIQLTTLEPGYETLDAEARLYRKVR